MLHRHIASADRVMALVYHPRWPRSAAMAGLLLRNPQPMAGDPESLQA